MIVYPNVTEEFMSKVAKLSAKQTKQRAEKNKIRKINQSHTKELAKNFKPSNKKLVEANESTEKLEGIIKIQVLKL